MTPSIGHGNASDAVDRVTGLQILVRPGAFVVLNHPRSRLPYPQLRSKIATFARAVLRGAYQRPDHTRT